MCNVHSSTHTVYNRNVNKNKFFYIFVFIHTYIICTYILHFTTRQFSLKHHFQQIPTIPHTHTLPNKERNTEPQN